MSYIEKNGQTVNPGAVSGIALALAGVSGIAVFPCDRDKKPLVEHGFKDATTDQRQITSWWTEHPDALIGMPTGPRNGIDVLDIDPRHGGDRWFRDHEADIPTTRTHSTRGSGLHLLFQHRPGTRNSEGRIAPGVDVRGDGGYAIWWPDLLRDAPMAEWPTWLAVEATKAAYSGPADAKEPIDLAPSGLTVRDLVTVLQGMPNPASCGRGTYEQIMQSIAGARRGIIAHHGPLAGADEDSITAAAAGWASRWAGWDATEQLAKAHGDPVGFERAKWETDWRDRGQYAGWDNLVGHALYLGMPEAATIKAAVDSRSSGKSETDFTAEPLPTRDALLNRLGIRSWIKREIAPPDRLLGDLLTTTARVFLVGRTGLGKTNLALAIGVHLAAGADFLAWHCGRPVRVLYLDGEMPPDLIQERVAEAEKRLGRQVPDGNLLIYSAVDGEDFGDQFPGIGLMPPLNSASGHEWLKRLITALGGCDLVIFDNVMSLLSGDQKDELAWSETLPLVQWLTSQRIGQLWLDHTGHETSRQYGSSTKGWRMDAIGIMSTVDDTGATDGDLAFKLSFNHPGKARRRTPRNWHDFEDRIIRLSGDRWSSEPVTAPKHHATTAKALTTDESGWLDAIKAVFATKAAGTVVDLGEHVKLHRDVVRDGLKASGRFQLDVNNALTTTDRTKWHKVIVALKDKGRIGMAENEIWLTNL